MEEEKTKKEEVEKKLEEMKAKESEYCLTTYSHKTIFICKLDMFSDEEIKKLMAALEEERKKSRMLQDQLDEAHRKGKYEKVIYKLISLLENNRTGRIS